MTKHAAVIGNPIHHSKSPKLHNHWLKMLGIDGNYQAVEAPIDDFEGTIENLRAKGFQGANVTIPFKEEAAALADEKSEMVKLVGAANTLIFQSGKIIADNTDGFGFGANILNKYPEWNVEGKHIVLGAGGAARAIIGWLIQNGASQIIIINRNKARAEALCNMGANISAFGWDNVGRYLVDAASLINTTSLGMNGENDITIDLTSANKSMIVNDIVYTPLDTGLLKNAQLHGLETVDGLGMLLWQARPGFAAWFGQEPPAIDQDLRELMLSK